MFPSYNQASAATLATPTQSLDQSQRLCKLLVKGRFISLEQMKAALYEHRLTGQPVDHILSQRNWLDVPTFHRVLLKQYRQNLANVIAAMSLPL